MRDQSRSLLTFMIALPLALLALACDGQSEDPADKEPAQWSADQALEAPPIAHEPTVIDFEVHVDASLVAAHYAAALYAALPAGPQQAMLPPSVGAAPASPVLVVMQARAVEDERADIAITVWTPSEQVFDALAWEEPSTVVLDPLAACFGADGDCVVPLKVIASGDGGAALTVDVAVLGDAGLTPYVTLVQPE